MFAISSSSIARTARAIDRSLARLSSGKRVNSAADDSAAFSMITGLNSQAQGLRQGLLNINQSQSMVTVADSALSSQLEILQRMREIGVQGANGTLSSADREALNNELQSLVDEFTRITNETEFNGHKLLDGSFGTLSTQTGLNRSIDYQFENGQATSVFRKTAGNGAIALGETIANSLNNRAVETVDVNNDGHIDLVFASFDTEVSTVHLGNGDGTFQSAVTSFIVDMWGASAMSVGDVNNDGVTDLIVSSIQTGLSISLGTGDGRFQFRSTYGNFGAASRIKVGDIDNDGDLDVVTGLTGSISIYTNDGEGTFTFAKSFFGTHSTSQIDLHDANSDGQLDIVSPGNGNLAIFTNQGGLNFSETITSGTAAGGAGQASIGDFDGDGDADIGFRDGVSRYLIFANNGSGTFTLANSFNALTYSGTTATDINGDGLDDILTTHGAGNGISVHINQGGYSFVPSQHTTQPNLITDSGFADFNEDGVMDAVTADRDPNPQQIYLGVATDVSAMNALSVATEEKAQKLITILDTAIGNITDHRAELSALHARLDTEASLSLMLSESLDEARSRAEDADIVEETAELVRNQILQQAQIASMAQANVSAQIVLRLLY